MCFEVILLLYIYAILIVGFCEYEPHGSKPQLQIKNEPNSGPVLDFSGCVLQYSGHIFTLPITRKEMINSDMDQ